MKPLDHIEESTKYDEVSTEYNKVSTEYNEVSTEQGSTKYNGLCIEYKEENIMALAPVITRKTPNKV